MLFSHLQLLIILDEVTPYTKPSSAPSLVSFIQLKVGLCRKKDTYLAHIKEIDEKKAEQKVPEPVATAVAKCQSNAQKVIEGDAASKEHRSHD